VLVLVLVLGLVQVLGLVLVLENRRGLTCLIGHEDFPIDHRRALKM
jgi:hypothetical protein